MEYHAMAKVRNRIQPRESQGALVAGPASAAAPVRGAIASFRRLMSNLAAILFSGGLGHSPGGEVSTQPGCRLLIGLRHEAGQNGIAHWRGKCRPARRLARLEQFGRKTDFGTKIHGAAGMQPDGCGSMPRF